MGTKEESIANSNKLIAVFMGARFFTSPYGGEGYTFEETIIDMSKWQEIKNAKYHTSWDWLMPVIDDIYYSRRFPTGAQTTEISSKPHRLWLEIKNSLLNLSIDQTWQAVVQFIKFYNTITP